MSNPNPLILASSSPFRQALLQRLNLPFKTASPDIDETQKSHETPIEYVQRLSLEKAKAVSTHYPGSLIIGSDQCAVLDNEIRGKPMTHEKAMKQLQQSSGKRVTFLSGLCLYNSRNNDYKLDVVPFHVDFRTLAIDEIERYLHQEKPYRCAGSFKSEGLGITLFKQLEGEDPTALIGLPLIKLSEFLRTYGVNLP